jgi:predicted phosphodiesterase
MIKTCFLYVFLFFLSGQLWAQNDRIPVTKKSFNDDSTTFRFAIVSDRNGGMRPGVFENAIDKLNLLQPEFVLSVGDLIDGYTEDANVWNAEWDEFDALVNKLDMPFYYVPGNHDTSNKLLTEAWKERHGRDYYYFVHKSVLFIALNTDEINDGGISEKQVEYVKKVLNEHQDVQWTFVFMHRPLWSYGDQAGFKEIGNALKRRKYTLFSAHHHNYQYQVVDGMDHYVLATTGGGSYMRGPDVGELDQITWVTMKKDGPKVANLDLTGIYDKNLVPPGDYDDIQTLREGNWLKVKPSVQNAKAFSSFPVNLIIKNNMKRSMVVSGNLDAQYGIHFNPSSVSEKIAPGKDKTIIVNVIADEGQMNIETLNNHPVAVTLNAGFERENLKNISLSTNKTLLVDWKHDLAKTQNTINIDGVLKEWDQSAFISVLNPQYFYEDWDWKGPEDGKFSFKVNTDSKTLFIAVKFTDDRIILDKKQVNALQDKFYVHLSTSPSDNKNFYQLEFAATNVAKHPLMNIEAKKLKGLKAAIVNNSNNQVLELAIPLESIQALKSDAIRINIGVMDQDHPENTKPSVLWWRPVWGSSLDYTGSSTFYIPNEK